MNISYLSVFLIIDRKPPLLSIYFHGEQIIDITINNIYLPLPFHHDFTSSEDGVGEGVGVLGAEGEPSQGA